MQKRELEDFRRQARKQQHVQAQQLKELQAAAHSVRCLEAKVCSLTAALADQQASNSQLQLELSEKDRYGADCYDFRRYMSAIFPPRGRTRRTLSLANLDIAQDLETGRHKVDPG